MVPLVAFGLSSDFLIISPLFASICLHLSALNVIPMSLLYIFLIVSYTVFHLFGLSLMVVFKDLHVFALSGEDGHFVNVCFKCSQLINSCTGVGHLLLSVQTRNFTVQQFDTVFTLGHK